MPPRQQAQADHQHQRPGDTANFLLMFHLRIRLLTYHYDITMISPIGRWTQCTQQCRRQDATGSRQNQEAGHLMRGRVHELRQGVGAKDNLPPRTSC